MGASCKRPDFVTCTRGLERPGPDPDAPAADPQRYLATYLETRARLKRVPMETGTGDALRAWLLGSYESQHRQLIQLRDEVARSG